MQPKADEVAAAYMNNEYAHAINLLNALDPVRAALVGALTFQTLERTGESGDRFVRWMNENV